MYKCRYCGCREADVSFSPTLGCYACDSCYTDEMDNREQENIDACYSNGEQDF